MLMQGVASLIVLALLSGCGLAEQPEPAALGLLALISGGIYFTRRFFIA